MNRNTNDLISIIVPVYNAEKTVGRTLVSLQNQDYPNLEIVLVNDGSADASEQICAEFQKKDSRISLYSIQNSGPAAARQYGIDRAKGRYLAFCDADDTVEPTMIRELYELMSRENCQLSICSVNRTADAEVRQNEVTKVWDNEKAICECMGDESVGGYMCNKLFDSSIIRGDEIRLDSTAFCCEDLKFVTEYLLHCKKAAFTTKVLYHYLYQEQSITANPASWKTLTHLFVRDQILKMLEKAGLHKAARQMELSILRQSVYTGRLLEKVTSDGTSTLTDEQLKKLMETIEKNCRTYGMKMTFRGKCSSDVIADTIRLGYLKKWRMT